MGSYLHKNLTRRYLIWAYKTTRESFERIERKTTQLKVDEYLLKILKQLPKVADKSYQKYIEEFQKYILNKRKDELIQKFADAKKQSFHSEYLYYKNRLSAIERAIKHFLGKQDLKRIEELYEDEFIKRILQAKEH